MLTVYELRNFIVTKYCVIADSIQNRMNIRLLDIKAHYKIRYFICL